MPALAQQTAAGTQEDVSAVKAEAALLEALLKRRSEIAAEAGNSEGKRHALEFLDRRIAAVRRSLQDATPAVTR